MTERGLPIVDGAPACPFVAFEDDRDQRAASPDHRHRCYAEAHPAPRALAHQEAYCLSSAFPVCPTFQDWARREAARESDARAERRSAERRPIEAPADQPVDDVVIVPSVPADEPPGVQEPDPGWAASDEIPPRRNPPRRWTAPPPWVDEGHDRPVDGETVGPEFLADRSRPGQGLAGSAADRLAGGATPGSSGSGATWSESLARSPRPPEDDDGGEPGIWGGLDPAADDDGGDSPSSPETPRPRRVARSSGVGLPIGDRRPRVGQARPRRPVDDDAPSWERPRRYEAYPSLRTRVGLPSVSLPPLALATIALVVAALALFFLPAFFGVGAPDDETGGRPSASVRPSASASVAPTASPAPTQQVYVVAAGDTLSRIATRFELTVDQILAANPQITNANRIAVGDEIIIPKEDGPTPSEVEGASPSPSA